MKSWILSCTTLFWLGTACLMAAAAPQTPVRAEASVVLSDDFKTSTPIASYPSPVNPIPGLLRNQGWFLTFEVPPDSSPLASGLLVMQFKKTASNSANALAFEAYISIGPAPLDGLNPASDAFLGSALGQLSNNQGRVGIILDSAKPFLFPGQTVRLLVIPVGDPVRSPTPVLSDTPSLFVYPRIYSFEDLMRPLWQGTRTIDEPVIFFRSKPTGAPKAMLLHAPRKVERVYSYSTGKSYAEGTDWRLTENGRLIAPPGSSIKVTDDAELHPLAEQGIRVFKTNDGRFLTSSENIWNHQRDLWITYEHEADWGGPIPTLASKELPHTLGKLRAREPVKIVVYGDSISVGAGASSLGVLRPFLLPWPNLLTQRLREHYQVPVTVINRSQGGMIASWGVDNAALLVEPETPDLCIIGFGMNDRSQLVPAAKFAGQIDQIMRTVREGNPNVEFILLSSALNNPEWGPTQPLWDYRADMFRRQGPGVAVADLTAVDQQLLKKKPFIDTSGNNVNHPNDYLVRWYAQVMAALLVNDSTNDKR